MHESHLKLTFQTEHLGFLLLLSCVCVNQIVKFTHYIGHYVIFLLLHYFCLLSMVALNELSNIKVQTNIWM